MTVASIDHIELDTSGTARILGHRTKVIQIVMDKMANSWSPEELQSQYSHLSLGQIHAALAYYYDHQAELDAQIESDEDLAEQLRSDAQPSPVVDKLRSMGKLP